MVFLRLYIQKSCATIPSEVGGLSPRLVFLVFDRCDDRCDRAERLQDDADHLVGAQLIVWTVTHDFLLSLCLFVPSMYILRLIMYFVKLFCTIIVLFS